MVCVSGASHRSRCWRQRKPSWPGQSGRVFAAAAGDAQSVEGSRRSAQARSEESMWARPRASAASSTRRQSDSRMASAVTRPERSAASMEGLARWSPQRKIPLRSSTVFGSYDMDSRSKRGNAWGMA